MDGGLRCPECGKSIPAYAERPWDRVMCFACGAWVSADIARQTWEELEAARAAADDAAAAEPQVAAESEYAALAAARHWARPAPKPHSAAGLYIAVAVCAAAAGALAMAVLMRSGEGREDPLAKQVLALKTEAEALVGSGQLAEAHERYQQIEQAIAGREITDPNLRENVQSARSARERLFEILLERHRTGQPAAQTAADGPATRATAGDAVAVEKPDQQTKEPLVLPPVPSPEGPLTIARSEPPKADAPAAPAVAAQQPASVKEPPAPQVLPRKMEFPRRPPVSPMAVESGGVSDEAIGAAIKRGAEYLLAQFSDGALRRDAGGESSRYAGLNALCVYALLQCGQAIRDERLNVRAGNMKQMIDRMRDMPIRGSCETYARAIRATALAVYNRPEDRAVLKEDVAWLIKAARHGAYTYREPAGTGAAVWDNSNSQYGLLGVWSGAEVGMEVPRTYWAQVQNHWFECQHDTGEWGYGHANQRDGRPSMTVAGLASLFVTHDYLDAPQFGTAVGREPFSKPLARGLQWLESGDNCLRMAGGFSTGYTLYGLERVGLASGFKYFGRHDWYRSLAEMLVRAQSPTGAWGSGYQWRGGGDLIETAYALLFLARGRHPILMNKLRFEGCWANRPRDVANLARFATRELERPINWQVVPIERDWCDWLDCPILYIASHEPIKLDAPVLSRLRRFVEAGGLIFTQADGNSASFDRFVIELGTKLFPDYEWMDLPQDHELYTLNFQVEPRPKLKYLSNGSRLLMVHSPQDLAQHWQLRAEKTKRFAFDLGLNLFIYAAGKADLRNRLNSPYLPPPPRAGDFRVKLARVKYAGLWDPEPHAIERFARWFAYQTGYALDVATIDTASLDARIFPIAHLTGTGPHAFPAAEVEALRRYVEDGGTLIIDACGGSWNFDAGVADMLARAFPARKPQLVAFTHPILSGGGAGMEVLTRPLMRTYAENKLGRGAAKLHMLASGNGRLIYSPLDITTGLLGTGTWSILGYRSEYAMSLLKNIVLWAADGCPERY